MSCLSVSLESRMLSGSCSDWHASVSKDWNEVGAVYWACWRNIRSSAATLMKFPARPWTSYNYSGPIVHVKKSLQPIIVCIIAEMWHKLISSSFNHYKYWTCWTWLPGVCEGENFPWSRQLSSGALHGSAVSSVLSTRGSMTPHFSPFTGANWVTYQLVIKSFHSAV